MSEKNLFELRPTYENMDLIDPYKGTKVYKEDLNTAIRLIIEGLEMFREEQDEIVQVETGEVDKLGKPVLEDKLVRKPMYDRMKNLGYQDFSYTEKTIMYDLLKGLEDTKSSAAPLGKQAIKRIKDLEKLVSNGGLLVANEGDTEEVFEYDKNGEIKKILVTGDYKMETEFFYSYELDKNFNPNIDENLLLEQKTKFLNEDGFLVTVHKKYEYQNLNGDNNIVKLITKTENDDQPLEELEVLGIHINPENQKQVVTTTSVSQEEYPKYEKDIVVGITEVGEEEVIAENEMNVVEFEPEERFIKYFVRRVSKNGASTTGVEIVPVKEEESGEE